MTKPLAAIANTDQLRTEPHPFCPICGSLGTLRHSGLVDRAHNIPGSWTIRACTQCSIGWLDPQPIVEDIGLAYPQDYYTHEGVSTQASSPVDKIEPFPGDGLNQKIRRLVMNTRYGYKLPVPDFPGANLVGRTLGSLETVRYRLFYRKDNAIPPWRKQGRLLDIGCGGGAYLAMVKALGWEPYGIEPDPIAAKIAVEKVGAKVSVGTLDDVDLPVASFDAVVSMHSIEHAADPRRFLRAALRLLRPGGVFYLQTPNFNSLMHRRFGADWYALEPPRHLCILSVPALLRLCKELSPWASLSVRSMPRRAMREQEHVIALRQTGNFHGAIKLSTSETIRLRAWSAIEHAGNRNFGWGEEVEVMGVRG